MTTYFHIGGEYGGTWQTPPPNTPGLNYHSPNGTSYVIHHLDNDEWVYAEATLCWRDVNTFHHALARQGRIPPQPAFAEATVNQADINNTELD